MCNSYRGSSRDITTVFGLYVNNFVHSCFVSGKRMVGLSDLRNVTNLELIQPIMMLTIAVK